MTWYSPGLDIMLVMGLPRDVTGLPGAAEVRGLCPAVLAGLEPCWGNLEESEKSSSLLLISSSTLTPDILGTNNSTVLHVKLEMSQQFTTLTFYAFRKDKCLIYLES